MELEVVHIELGQLQDRRIVELRFFHEKECGLEQLSGLLKVLCRRLVPFELPADSLTRVHKVKKHGEPELAENGTKLAHLLLSFLLAAK